jgi:hypothetical protein
MVEFEWDETKSISNLEKHEVDFLTALDLFDGRPVMTRPALFPGEERYSTTGLLGQVLYTAIWTWRDERVRLISARRARHGERRAYRAIHMG